MATANMLVLESHYLATKSCPTIFTSLATQACQIRQAALNKASSTIHHQKRIGNMSSRNRHHQVSLQAVVDLSASPPLADDVRIQADHRFHQIVEHFQSGDTVSAGYDRPKLVGLVYRYATSPKSKDNVLRAFFRAMELPMEGGAVDFSDEDQTETMRSHLVGFAEHLVNNFFMPLRALAVRTPQLTPHYRSATLRSSSRDFVGTPDRLSALRGDCLIRDRHRCVISRAFDMSEAFERQNRGQMLDDDGDPIDDDNMSYLEVAHILPHSLVRVGSETQELVCIFLLFTLFLCFTLFLLHPILYVFLPSSTFPSLLPVPHL